MLTKYGAIDEMGNLAPDLFDTFPEAVAVAEDRAASGPPHAVIAVTFEFATRGWRGEPVRAIGPRPAAGPSAGR